MGYKYLMYGVPESIAHDKFPVPPAGTIIDNWWPGLQAWHKCSVIGLKNRLLYCKDMSGNMFGDMPTLGNFRECIYGQQMDLFDNSR